MAVFDQLRRRRAARVPRRSAGEEDARVLALEVAGLRPEVLIDPMALGLVLGPGEKVYRTMQLWLSHKAPGGWSVPILCPTVVTNERLIVRMPLGGFESLWWRSLVGFDPRLERSTMLLDYGDGFPRRLSGPGVPAAAVVGVAVLYGVAALADHAALECLRDRPA